MKIESIWWLDACTVEGNLEDIGKKRLPIVESVGYLVYEDAEKVILCCHRDLSGAGEIETGDGDEGIVIPRVLIVSRRECIKEGGETGAVS